jgi:predicted RNA-binding Zn-ribbon protein involved in translation (DUF1610 family)
MTNKYCVSCGSELKNDAHFCANCGKKIIRDETNGALSTQKVVSSSGVDKQSKGAYTTLKYFSVIVIIIIFVFGFYKFTGNSENSSKISPESLIPKLESKLGIDFKEDSLGKVVDVRIERWFGSENSDRNISILFYPDADSVLASEYLKNEFKVSSYFYCRNFVAIDRGGEDIEMIYNVLVENYTDCLIPNATPEADGGEISQSDSEVEIGEVYPECRRVANTKNGGLAIVPGWQWQRADGQIGYCILPNSGGEKYYYPGLN